MPRTGIAILVSLMIVVTYGVISQGGAIAGNTDIRVADTAEVNKPKADFTIIF